MKRFYTHVNMHKTPNGFEIHLDDRPVKTDSKHTLCTPYEDVAKKIMEEWQAQEGHIMPDSMPMTQIITTQIDRDISARPKLTTTLLKYIDTDLIYYGVLKPEELKREQEKHWGKWIRWAETKHGVTIKTTQSLHAVKQDDELHDGIAHTIEAMCDDKFTILQTVVPITGSVVLSLAFMESQIGAEDILKAIFIEEDYKDQLYNAEKYGSDPLILQNKQNVIQDLQACTTYRNAILNQQT